MSKDGLMAAVAAAAGSDDAKPVVVTAELIKTHFPEVAAKLSQEGKEAGAEAERQRVSAIRAALIPGHEKIIEAMAADPKMTEVDALRAMAAEERKVRATAKTALDDDEKKVVGLRSEHGPANGQESEPKKTAKTPQTPDGWKAEWAASEDLQAEFKTEGAYVAFKAAEKSGSVRVLNKRAS